MSRPRVIVDLVSLTEPNSPTYWWDGFYTGTQVFHAQDRDGVVHAVTGVQDNKYLQLCARDLHTAAEHIPDQALTRAQITCMLCLADGR